MKQPKFKFGDKVTYGTTVFVVKSIFHIVNTDYYRYSDKKDGYYYTENNLELYVEPPRTKKVYQFIFKLEGQRPILRAELWSSEEDLRYHIAHSINARDNVEYIKIANTFEVPE